MIHPAQATAEEVIAREIAENYDDSLASVKLANGIINALHSAGHTIVGKTALEALVRAAEPFSDAAKAALVSGRPPFEFVGADDYERVAAALLPFKDVP